MHRTNCHKLKTLKFGRKRSPKPIQRISISFLGGGEEPTFAYLARSPASITGLTRKAPPSSVVGESCQSSEGAELLGVQANHVSTSAQPPSKVQ